MTDAAAFRERALSAARYGRLDEAVRIFREAALRFPHDAALLNSIGNFHASRGEDDEALHWFDRALGATPDHVEASLNRAIVLTRRRRAREAAAILTRGEARMQSHPRYWTARGSAELAAQDPMSASVSYDRALQREPGLPRALHGRAQAALDVGSADAIIWLERALAASPGDRHLLRNLAQAYEAAGRTAEALNLTHALATQLPDWIEGLEAHAALRWSLGDRRSFCDHYEAAARRAPSPALYQSWALTLAGVDRHAEAAAIASEGRRRWPQQRSLAVTEVMATGMAGDDVAAGALLASVADDDPIWRVHRARHLLRVGDIVAAEALLATIVEADPGDIDAWSLREVAWRLLGDARHAWLVGDGHSVREMALDLPDNFLSRMTSLLDQLHDRAGMPVGQSVKEGSQTRGALFARAEPELRLYAQAIGKAVDVYRTNLPTRDDAHPLLRHRDDRWTIAGSWSIRLTGRGGHAPHIHPRGLLSSASYVVVPPEIDHPDRPGWLELGRPPSDLRTDLAPLASIRPRPGVAVLFPSFLFHGTRPITSGKRMTVAFDIGSNDLP